MRRLAPESLRPITVNIRGGEYYMTKGVVFDEADSGTECAPITYRAYNGEAVRKVYPKFEQIPFGKIGNFSKI